MTLHRDLLLLSLCGLTGVAGFAQSPAKEERTLALGPNRLSNPGFEQQGLDGWAPSAGGRLRREQDGSWRGAAHLVVTGRTSTLDGCAQQVGTELARGVTYSVSCRVRVAGASRGRVRLALREAGASTVAYVVDERVATDAEWRRLWGAIPFVPNDPDARFDLVVDGPEAGVELHVDEVSLVELPDWRAFMRRAAERNRKRYARLTVRDASGAPMPGVAVHVEQKEHDFAFGSVVNSRLVTNPSYLRFFLDHFEWAVFENETKWPRNEREQGELDFEDADAMVAICAANGIRMRGHTLFWSNPSKIQPWVTTLAPELLWSAMEARIEATVGRYAGRFRHWDVNNEMMRHAWYVDRLGPSIRPWMFQRAHEEDPDALLFTNELGVLMNPGRSHDYVDLVDELRAGGAPVGGIGVQGHFVRDIDPWTLWIRLSHLAESGLPLWITEFDTVTPDPEQRADRWEALYRTAFAHPAVEGVVAWGFWTRSHWRGPEAAIVEDDWTLNAAGRRYEAMRDAWWSEASGTTNARGELELRGFHGSYEVTLGSPMDGERTVTFELPPEQGPLLLDVTVQP